MRENLETLAERGNARALAALEGPECPEELAYLWGYAVALVGRSGVGVDGLAPLSYGTIEAWSRLMDIPVSPLEIEALLLIDAAMRHPGEPEREA